MDIEAGFEIWQGGQGLQANSLSICTPSPVGCENVARAAASPLSSTQSAGLSRSRRCLNPPIHLPSSITSVSRIPCGRGWPSPTAAAPLCPCTRSG
jgi:hypothetical protein